MKAKQWSELYKSDKQEEFFASYAEETAKLIEERTKHSGVVTLRDGKTKVNTKLGVVDGVLREQRQKWDAVCRKITAEGGSLTTEMFDINVLGTYLPAVIVKQDNTKQEGGEEEVPKGVDGRKLADSLA